MTSNGSGPRKMSPAFTTPTALTPEVPQTGRPALTRERILSAAVVLIDRAGVPGLTMRGLGEVLGVEAMAVYHHLPGRESVLNGVVDQVLDELSGDPEVRFDNPDWREVLQGVARGFRRMALAHPGVFPMIATRVPGLRWIKPPLRDLGWIEQTLAMLRRCGFSDLSSVTVYHAFSSFLLGHLLLEVSPVPADTGSDSADLSKAAGASCAVPTPGLDAYPLLRELEPLLAVNRSAQEFARSLADLLDRLQLDTGCPGQPRSSPDPTC